MSLGTVARSVASRAGRRGAFLLFLAVLDGLYGYSLLVTPSPQRAQDFLLPWEAWAGIWLGTGAVCLSGVFARRDKAQFTAAVTLKLAWGLLYAQLWLAGAVPRAWVAALVWLAFAAAVFLVSGWPEPVRITRPPDPDPPDGPLPPGGGT